MKSIFLLTSLDTAFLEAISSAISEISADVTCASFKYFAKLIVIAPEPVPISKIFNSDLLLLIFIISYTNVSVSGLGIKTPSFTKKSNPINSLLPII